MKRILTFLFIIAIASLLTPEKILAVCPVCTLAAAGGLGLSRYLGIDDTVSGLWIGGLVLAAGLWLADWMAKKNWKIPRPKLLSILLILLLTIPPLYRSKMIGLPWNKLWGIDKVVLGAIFGSSLFLAGVFLDKYLRNFHNNKVYFYYQKVIIPVVLLILGSFSFYFITKN